MRHHHPAHHPLGHPSRLAQRLLLEPDWPLREAWTFIHHALASVLSIAPLLAGLALGACVTVAVIRGVLSRLFSRDARLIGIGVPPEIDPDGAQLLWSSLHDLLRPPLARLFTGQPHLAWEIAASETGTTFRLWVPRRVPHGLVERAVCSAWPGATITNQDAATEKPDDAGMVAVASELVLRGPDWFSIDSTLKPDPLPLILAQLSGLAGDERALVQVLARPATIREQHRLRAAARRIRAGVPTSRFWRLIAFMRSSPAATPSPPRHDPTISPDVADVMAKSAQSLYRCLVRVTVVAGTRPQARGRIHAVLSGFAAYEGRVGLRRRHAWRACAKLSARQFGHRGFLLSVGELAALCHLPGTVAIPGVVMGGARDVPPPPGLPSEGKPLGRASDGRPVNLAVADARQHIHILGPTGVGKSTLIANLALADFKAGRGVVVIDPKGDLVEDLLARIPKGREHEVDLLDPLDEAPPGLNVLDSPDRDLGVDQLVGIFRRVFERFWGPRTDDILRASLLTLTDTDKDATLADVPALLMSRERQAQLAAQVQDPMLEAFWDWWATLSDAVRAQVTGPVLNKLRAFLLRGPVRAIVGQSTTTLEIPRCLDQGRLLLAKLPKGTLGEDTSRLLGSFLFARVWQATLARASLDPEQRRDAACYVDEVHNYLNLPTPFEDVLTEARSYRLCLCLAHQHLAQLPRELREALSANARTKVCFQLSRDDAVHVERDVRPQLTAHDLTHLPRYTAAVRLCHNGEPTSAFTLTTRPLPEPIPGRAQTVRQAARRRTGPREDVDQRLGRDSGQPLQRQQRAGPPSTTPDREGAVSSAALGAAIRAAPQSAAPPAAENPREHARSDPGGDPDKGSEQR